jgi:hypothetical protein
VAVLGLAGAVSLTPGQDWWEAGQAPEPSTATRQIEFQQESRGKTLSLTDWAGGRIVVKAAGAADARASANLAQARLMAEEAARAMAALRIAEIVDGLRITSETNVREAMVRNQSVRTQVNAFLKGIRYGEPRAIPQPDGSIIVEVVASLGFFGDQGLVGTIQDAIPQEGRGQGKPPAAAEKPSTPYTGVIVDATGLAVRPGLAPRILTETKREVYGAADVPRDYVIVQGMVGYAPSVADAKQKTDRVGSNPLVVRAVATDEKNGLNVIVSPEDAGRILGADRDSRALKEARVIFVLN